MLSLFNKKGSNVPEWASFFSNEEYGSFMEAIDKYFEKIGTTYRVEDGVIHPSTNEFGFEKLGLYNVAQVCHQNALTNYKRIVEEHFETLLRSKKFSDNFSKSVSEYTQVEKYIGVRFYSNDYINQLGREFCIVKEVAGDIVAVLVFDLPDSIMNIKPKEAEGWNIPIETLFEKGLNNIRNNYQLKITQVDFGELKLHLVQGDHFFTANILFDLQNYSHLIGKYGALIGAPHRHAVIIYPIHSTEVIKAINALIPAVYGMNQEGPGSLSNNLLWYHDGEFENLPYKIETDKLSFLPPNKFVKLIEKLAQEQ